MESNEYSLLCEKLIITGETTLNNNLTISNGNLIIEDGELIPTDIFSVDNQGNVFIGEKLEVLGNTYLNSLSIKDSIIKIDNNDNLNKGILFNWKNITKEDKLGFFGYDYKHNYLTFIPDAIISSKKIYGQQGIISAKLFKGDISFNNIIDRTSHFNELKQTPNIDTTVNEYIKDIYFKLNWLYKQILDNSSSSLNSMTSHLNFD